MEDQNKTNNKSTFLSKQWSHKRVILFYVLIIPTIWFISFVILAASPTEETQSQMRGFWGLMWAIFAFLIVYKRKGGWRDRIIFPIIGMVSTALSIFTIILFWWMLVKYNPNKQKNINQSQKSDA